ncbi:pyridoxine 5'-phosphate synthase [soil metagenome]
MTRLSVNLNKVALLRNARGGSEPDLLRAARACLAAGAHGLTLHPRPDARHARAEDVQLLAQLAQAEGAEFNLEGNPFAAPRANYPGFMALCAQARPTQATLVPDADGQLTSDHGFDFARDAARLQPVIAALKALGCRVSLFADTGSAVSVAAGIGADRIELYTGPYADACAGGRPGEVLRGFADTAARAQQAGLGVNAGHDLNQHNLRRFLAEVPDVLEVSIGHALVAEALHDGLDATVRLYRALVDASV